MIYLTQWLCPSRHCLIAIAWDSTQETEQSVIDRGEEFLRGSRQIAEKDLAETKGVEEYVGKRLERCCGLCRSKDIHTETGRTAYKTIDQAQLAIAKLQRINMVAKQILTERKN